MNKQLLNRRDFNGFCVALGLSFFSVGPTIGVLSSASARAAAPMVKFPDGTIVPSGNFTIGAAARADALDSTPIVGPTEKNDKPSATQNPLKSRRFSNCLFILHSQRLPRRPTDQATCGRSGHLPASSLHHMQPVTRGMRLAAIFRIHSLVREIARSYNVSHSTISRL